MAAFDYTPVPAYIYFYHTDEYFIIPQLPEAINDSLNSSFNEQHALSRTAPVFSYRNSGPRTVQFSLNLHRDMMNQINTEGSNVKINNNTDIITSITDDYVDILIKKLQSVALPKFSASDKSIDPPKVAVRFGDEIFCKGVVNNGISIDYRLPFLENNKYAQVSVTFKISETTPYDAESAGQLGSFRGLTSGLKNKLSQINTGFNYLKN